MLVLDEMLVACSTGLVDESKLLAFLRAKPAELEVVQPAQEAERVEPAAPRERQGRTAKARRKGEAVRRARKLARKRAQREGLLPKPVSTRG